jgi:D-alanyl-D-alanine carboxypeptidase
MHKYMNRFVVLAVICLVSVSCGSDAPVPKILTEATKAQLETAADAVYAQLKPPGMIALVSVEGEGDFIIKRGVSNRETGRAMNEDYYFRIASNTKTFTGAALLILADEGWINLDKSIASYLPEYNIPNGDRITVRMLGNMTSGLFNYTDDTEFLVPFFESGCSLTFTPAELLAVAFRHLPNFEPGEKYEYCNTNTVLLGLLLEKRTGKPAKQVIEEKVIRPMGLTHTYWPDSVSLATPYTNGYTVSDGVTVDATGWNPSWGYTAGILVSTFADMKIWAKAVAEGTLLSEQAKAERFKWINNHYGFCVMNVDNWIGHPGTMFGYNSHVLYNKGKKITLVILVNMDTGTPVEFFSSAFRAILDQ